MGRLKNKNKKIHVRFFRGTIAISLHHSFIVHHCIDFLVGNEERLVGLLVYSSFRRGATSCIWNSSVFTRTSSWNRQAVLKWGVNTESLRIQHSTAAQYSCKNESDVTGIVVTEHIRNKYSLPESLSLQLSHDTCSSISIRSTARNFSYCNQSN